MGNSQYHGIRRRAPARVGPCFLGLCTQGGSSSLQPPSSFSCRIILFTSAASPRRMSSSSTTWCTHPWTWWMRRSLPWGRPWWTRGSSTWACSILQKTTRCILVSVSDFKSGFPAVTGCTVASGSLEKHLITSLGKEKRCGLLTSGELEQLETN